MMFSKNSAPLCAIFDAVACHFRKILASVGVVGERRNDTGHDDMHDTRRHGVTFLLEYVSPGRVCLSCL